jgi:hypothetical protein
VRFRRRRTWAGTTIWSATLAAVTLLASQGCSAASAGPAIPASPTLSISVAQAIYGSYRTASDSAAAHDEQTRGLAIAGGAQWSQLKAQYTALARSGVPVPRYRYGRPDFYVPALAGYPEWFMVAVPRQTDSGAHLGPVVNTIMLFDKFNKAAAWTLNGTAVLDQPLPAIARDRAGYAIDVINDDPSLLLRPDVVGASQAAVVDDGPDAASAAAIAAGPQTTGLYAAQAAIGRADAARDVQYQWLADGANYPQFELRTTDGGALTMYGMYLNTTAEHPGRAAGSPIPVPAEFTELFTTANEIGYHAVYANWTYQFAAVDPPATAHNTKVDIIGATGVPTYSRAY